MKIQKSYNETIRKETFIFRDKTNTIMGHLDFCIVDTNRWRNGIMHKTEAYICRLRYQCFSQLCKAKKIQGKKLNKQSIYYLL